MRLDSEKNSLSFSLDASLYKGGVLAPSFSYLSMSPSVSFSMPLGFECSAALPFLTCADTSIGSTIPFRIAFADPSLSAGWHFYAGDLRVGTAVRYTPPLAPWEPAGPADTTLYAGAGFHSLDAVFTLSGVVDPIVSKLALVFGTGMLRANADGSTSVRPFSIALDALFLEAINDAYSISLSFRVGADWGEWRDGVALAPVSVSYSIGASVRFMKAPWSGYLGANQDLSSPLSPGSIDACAAYEMRF